MISQELNPLKKKKMQPSKRPSSVSHSHSTQLPSPVNNKVSDEPRQGHGLPVCSQIAEDV